MLFVIMFIGSSFGVSLGKVPKSGGGWDSLSLLDAVEVTEEVRLSREMASPPPFQDLAVILRKGACLLR